MGISSARDLSDVGECGDERWCTIAELPRSPKLVATDCGEGNASLKLPCLGGEPRVVATAPEVCKSKNSTRLGVGSEPILRPLLPTSSSSPAASLNK